MIVLVSEEVHHVNGDKADNRLANLELTTKSEHIRRHYRSRRIDERGRLLSCSDVVDLRIV